MDSNHQASDVNTMVFQNKLKVGAQSYNKKYWKIAKNLTKYWKNLFDRMDFL